MAVMENLREFLAEATLSTELVDRFLDGSARNYGKFDPVLGYLERPRSCREGTEETIASASFGPRGERRMLNHADRPCRINTYGDSFTHCNQVNDGESWQEHLAAHIGEPVRNFGVGGYGVYQAYRRMLREEGTSASADYLILNIFSDDHYRNITKWRWLHLPGISAAMRRDVRDPHAFYQFNANPWARLRLNLNTRSFEECENAYPTPASLYQLCDADHVYESFADEFDVHVLMARKHSPDTDTGLLRNVADALGTSCDFSSPESTADSAEALFVHYTLRSTMWAVDACVDFTERTGKKLLVVLSYERPMLVAIANGAARFDGALLEHLDTHVDTHGVPYVDGLQKHLEDFSLFRCSASDYAARHYVLPNGGHYAPTGNQFFDFAIKDAVVDWLDPMPPSYTATD